MRAARCLRTAVLVLLAAAAGVAVAQPEAWVEWSGNTVFIKANTPSSPKYRCSYAVTATFSDGDTQVVRGQTDPPTGGSPISAAILKVSRDVSEAELTKWSCTTKE